MDYGANPQGICLSESTLGAVSSFSEGVGAKSGAYDGGSGFVYVANGGSASITVINGSSSLGTSTVGIDSGPSPRAPIYDYGNGYVYVPNNGSTNVTVIGFIGPAPTISGVSATVTSSGGNVYSSVTVSFSEIGSAWNYLYIGLSHVYSTGYEHRSTESSSHSLTLNYLNPGSTFYYSIVACPPNATSCAGSSNASYFSTPSIPKHVVGDIGVTKIFGYVLGSNGAPIDSAEINVTYSDGIAGQCFTDIDATTTQSNGSYSFYAAGSGGGGATCNALTWGASHHNDWAENWTLFSEPNSVAGWNWQTFYLTSVGNTSQSTKNSFGGQDGAPVALAYVHTENAYCSVQAGFADSNTVYAYDAGNGGSDTHFFKATGSFPGTGSPTPYGLNVGIFREYAVTGTYAIARNGGFSFIRALAVGGPSSWGGLDYRGGDPMVTPPVPNNVNSTFLFTNNYNTINYAVYADGTLQNQKGLTISIGASVGAIFSVSFSYTLNVGMNGTQTRQAGMECVLGSLSTQSTQWFEVDTQGGSTYNAGFIAHIWECKPAAGDTKPSTCTPIDQGT